MIFKYYMSNKQRSVRTNEDKFGIKENEEETLANYSSFYDISCELMSMPSLLPVDLLRSCDCGIMISGG